MLSDETTTSIPGAWLYKGEKTLKEEKLIVVCAFDEVCAVPWGEVLADSNIWKVITAQSPLGQFDNFPRPCKRQKRDTQKQICEGDS